jgi:formylglycine-generating enzyme required for sulfatase activity
MKTCKQRIYSTGTFAAIAAIFAVVFMNCRITIEQTPTTVKVEMVRVEGGSFEMGKDWGTAAAGDITPLHTVTLSGFSISKYPVTQAQYQAVMGSNPSSFSSNPASGEVQGKRPVDSVSWYNAIVFCNKLSLLEGLNPAYSINNSTDPSAWGDVPADDNNAAWIAVQIVSGSNGYRLPTEAQWEYASKGGDPNAADWTGYTYSGSDTVGEVAWYVENSGNKTHEVGKKAPNRLGLYDMSGNVYEWCWDWYGDYSSGAQTDPTGPERSSTGGRVKRGGSYFFSTSLARSVYRTYGYPAYGGDLKPGFRLVRP